MTISDALPHLAADGFTQTSPATTEYNCIAWAAGKTDGWWWPDPLEIYYWPEGVLRAETLEAFYLAFESLGYIRCEDGQLEVATEKIALYVRDAKPTHAARQLPDGSWTSKLGRWIDIPHTLHGLEGPAYGKVAGFVKRPTR
jgi:hypothetical protein